MRLKARLEAQCRSGFGPGPPNALQTEALTHIGINIIPHCGR
jgi:hypothetical protein